MFRLLDPEIWIVTAAHNDRRNGMVATFVNSASIVPALPRVLVGIAKHHFTWQLIEQSHSFALHLITENQIDWVWRFGLQSGRDADKLSGLMVDECKGGPPILRDALGWLECRVESTMDTGDRTVYLAEVVNGDLPQTEKPLTMQRMLALASADKLAVMREQLTADTTVDRGAIMEWREEKQLDGQSG